MNTKSSSSVKFSSGKVIYRNRRNEIIWDLEETYQRKMQVIRDFKKMMSGESCPIFIYKLINLHLTIYKFAR